MTIAPCPTCGKVPIPDVDGYAIIACDDCYDADCVGDPPEYRSTSPTGTGLTLAEAVANWNDAVVES